MDWKTVYAKKLASPQQAVGHIRSGQRVVFGLGNGAPEVLVDAMVQNAQQYTGVEIVNMLPTGPTAYCAPGMETHFHYNSLYVSGPARGPIAEGRADYVPVFFSEIPDLVRKRYVPDVALLHLSPPDEHGYCSFGVSVDYATTAAAMATTKIAQINPQMPRTMGECFIHVSELDVIVEAEAPLYELPVPAITDVEKRIGAHVAALIEDGDSLQLGIGALPDAVLAALGGKKHLGIHSEMFSDGVVDLMLAGVVDNSRKTLYPGKSVATFLLGTRKLYDFVHDNPAVHMLPVDVTNDPRVICRNDNLVSVNSCVQVDLMGQVVSDSIGLYQISAVGGQVDFVRGANMSRGGRSIIALQATTKHGHSKVVPFIEHGAAVTTSRNDVDYVVTEYGVARLKRKTLRERARELIEIAHPDARAELYEEYERRFHQKVWPGGTNAT